MDPERLFYVEPHDVSGITYPTAWGFEGGPAPPGPDFFPPWHYDTISAVVGRVGHDVSIHGEVFSPFSQLMELLDYSNALMALVDDPGKVRACLARLVEGTVLLANGQIEAGADAVLISSAFAGAGLISRTHYEEFVLPYERAVIAGIRERHAVPIYTHTCGAIGDRIDLMEATGTNGIDTLDPPPLGTVDLAEARRLTRGRLFIKGNVDPVHTLLEGDRAAVLAAARERIAVAGPGGGYILSTACSVAPAAPPDNVLALAEAAERWGQDRELIGTDSREPNADNRHRSPVVIMRVLAVMMAVAPMAAAQVPSPGVVSSEFVYETAPYPECHASTIVQAPSGTLVAAWFGGTKERAPDVSIYVARRDGARWGEARKVADGVQADGSRHPTWNPVLFQSPGRGPLFLFYKVGPSPREWWGMVTTSADEGRTWAAPTRLADGILGPIKNKPVVLADGTWLSPSSTEAEGNLWVVHFERSADQGRTWQKVGPVDVSRARFDAIQPSVLVHRDGSLQALCRTRQGVVGQTWSRDGGKTWGPMSATELPNPNSGTDAVTLADGRHLIVYNHAAQRPDAPGSGNRWPLDVAVSVDGLTWTRVLTLEREPLPSGYAYPAVIQAADGLVHITYTWDRKRIKHLVIDPRKF